MILLLTIVFPVFANSSSFELQEQIEGVSSVLERSDLDRDFYYSYWKLNTVRVRTILELGIEVPLITKFKIQPEIELYFSNK